MPPAIRIENLSKRYQIGTTGHDKTMLREVLAHAATAPIRRLRNRAAARSAAPAVNGSTPNGHPPSSTLHPPPSTLHPPLLPSALNALPQPIPPTEFWALKDVSFEIQQGEVVGIIGKNGAGKSTLLKVLSRIVEPTSGRVELHGRVGSLLEVGTGFHPELTGRENVFLNGAILGLKRREIQRKFDEIVDFSGIEQFIDTPVKRYSSGMYVRLAFSVAAHMDSEILIVDEVLAVGDAEFQKKCLGKVHDAAGSGRTVLLVSHNMPALEGLCHRGVFFEKGAVRAIGPIHDISTAYFKKNVSGRACYQAPEGAGLTRSGPYIREANLVDDGNEPTDFIRLGSRLCVRIVIELPDGEETLIVGVGIDDCLGRRMVSLNSTAASRSVKCTSGELVVNCEIPECPLAPGEYVVKLVLQPTNMQIESICDAFQFSVSNSNASNDANGFHSGMIFIRANWRFSQSGRQSHVRA